MIIGLNIGGTHSDAVLIGDSIESALPCVNADIIFAMAGLDYGRVREPDYRPAHIHHPPEN